MKFIRSLTQPAADLDKYEVCLKSNRILFLIITKLKLRIIERYLIQNTLNDMQWSQRSGHF